MDRKNVGKITGAYRREITPLIRDRRVTSQLTYILERTLLAYSMNHETHTNPTVNHASDLEKRTVSYITDEETVSYTHLTLPTTPYV